MFLLFVQCNERRGTLPLEEGDCNAERASCVEGAEGIAGWVASRDHLRKC